MKTLLVVLMLTGFGPIIAKAQQAEAKKNSSPHWTITKDVQRIQLRNPVFVPANVTTGNTGLTVSKGVQQAQVKRSFEPTGKVAMTGTPSWVISKGVARMQYERNNKR